MVQSAPEGERKGSALGLWHRTLSRDLVKEQWLKLLGMADEIRAFIAANDARLKAKDRSARVDRRKSPGDVPKPVA